MVTTTKVLANSQNQFHSGRVCWMKAGVSMPNRLQDTGADQPPRKSSAVRADTRIMLAYSARKNMAKLMPEYSIMCPATISDSPSTTSKGWRLVSARPEMK